MQVSAPRSRFVIAESRFPPRLEKLLARWLRRAVLPSLPGSYSRRARRLLRRKLKNERNFDWGVNVLAAFIAENAQIMRKIQARPAISISRGSDSAAPRRLFSNSMAAGMDQPRAGDSANRSYQMLVTSIQSSLYAYISALMGGDLSAHDVLQETNLVLWEKEGSYDPSRNFRAWALKIAKFQVLAHRKRQQRSRLVFDDSMVDVLAIDFEASIGNVDSRVEALQDCLNRLNAQQLCLLQQRYEQNQKVSTIANSLARTPNAVSMMLHRIRQSLIECVEQNSRKEGTA
jgi:RNA polymerase sigma-70 factor (ECF subfamily)